MKFKRGDRVKFLNDTGKGIVKGYADNKTILVEREDGFEIPVQVKELIPDNSMISYDGEEQNDNTKTEEGTFIKLQSPKEVKTETFEEFRPPNETMEKELIYDHGFIPKKGTILLAFIPADIDMVHKSRIKFYLINDSNYEIMFILSKQAGSKWSLIHSETLEADTKLFIEEFNQTELSKISKLLLQVIYYKPGEYQVSKPMHFEYDLRNVSFYKKQNFRENEYFESDAHVIDTSVNEFEEHIQSISEQELKDIIKEKEADVTVTEKLKNKNGNIEEVDLHIHELVENDKDLSDSEKLKIQMETFYNRLEVSIKKKPCKIVFIHGVGNGTLKYEIRKALDEKYPKLIYQDASFKEYGYGATLVNIK